MFLNFLHKIYIIFMEFTVDNYRAKNKNHSNFFLKQKIETSMF